jgi:hypothetical protein
MKTSASVGFIGGVRHSHRRRECDAGSGWRLVWLEGKHAHGSRSRPVSRLRASGGAAVFSPVTRRGC